MTDYSQQSAVGTGIAQAFGDGASASVNIGFTSEQIATLLQAAGAAQQARIDELAGQLHTGREAVRGFLRILQEEDLPVEQLRKRPNFPSGASSRLDLTIASWFSQKDREQSVVSAGGDRLQRSGGS